MDSTESMRMRAGASAENAAAAAAARAQREETEAKEEEAPARAVAALLERIRPNPLECRVCLKELTAGTTALLPCCHAFHRACLRQQVEVHREETLRCGVCWTEAVGVKDPADVAKLPKDVLVEATLAMAEEEARASCSLCEEEDIDDFAVVARCVTCSRIMCELHAALHKSKKFAAHVVEPLAASNAAPLLCPSHAGKLLEIYCVTCATVCCTMCLVSAHPRTTHQIAVLIDHAPTLLRGLVLARATGTARSDELLQKMTGLHTSLRDVDVRAVKLEDEVRRTIKMIVQRLALREQELLRELGTLTAQERAMLEAELSEEQRRWLMLEGALRAAQRLAVTESRLDHLGRLAGAVDAHLTTTSGKQVTPAPPAATIEFEVPDDVLRALVSAGRFVHRRAFGSECVADGPGVVEAAVSTGGRFKVTAWTWSKERRTVGGDRVTARLVSAGNGAAIDAVVADDGDGTYTVSYEVALAGEYRMDVDVNGRAVRGSPFNVMVTAGRLFTFTGPPYYDNKGVIYHLATAGGTRPWTNPHDSGVVEVVFSSIHNGPIANLVSNRVAVPLEYCNTYSEPCSWMSVSLRGKCVILNGYVASLDGHGALSGSHLLRWWSLEGSLDGTTWTLLKLHEDDMAITYATPTAYWPVEGQTTAYSHFRILQTGLNSSSVDNLMATGFEIYGEMFNL